MMVVQGQPREEGEQEEILKVKCTVDGFWWPLVNEKELNNVQGTRGSAPTCSLSAF